MLVLCDHERAGATLPADLTGVIDQQAGSAHAMLAALVAAPETGRLNPMLVTGKTVAGAAATLHGVPRTGSRTATLAGTLRVEPLAAGSTTCSRSSARGRAATWVGLVTTYFQDGHCQVLVGTRALLGEGWDAKRITGLADVTAVTTITSVVQTRGRALRTDPLWPEKVAVNWSLVCVSDKHPKGGNDWDRLVRKHAGLLRHRPRGPDRRRRRAPRPVASRRSCRPRSPSSTPPTRAPLVRSEQRATIREQWQVGQPYVDTARLRRSGSRSAGCRAGSASGSAPVRRGGAPSRRRRAARHPHARGARPGHVAAGRRRRRWPALVAGVVGAPLVLAGGVLVGAAAAVRPGPQPPPPRRGAAARGRGGAVGHPDRLGRRRRAARRRADPPRLGLGRGGRSTPTGSTAASSTTSTRSRPRSSRPPSTRRSRRSACRATCCRAGSGPSGADVSLVGGRLWAGFGRLRPDGVVWHAVPTVLGVERRARRGVRQGLGPLGRRRRPRLHRLARGPGHPGRPAGHRPVRRQHGDAAPVGLSAGPASSRGQSLIQARIPADHAAVSPAA